MKTGIYRTDYGNAAIVKEENTNEAYDLDMAQVIPIRMVTTTFVRKADECELDLFDDMTIVDDDDLDNDGDLDEDDFSDLLD